MPPSNKRRRLSFVDAAKAVFFGVPEPKRDTFLVEKGNMEHSIVMLTAIVTRTVYKAQQEATRNIPDTNTMFGLRRNLTAELLKLCNMDMFDLSVRKLIFESACIDFCHIAVEDGLYYATLKSENTTDVIKSFLEFIMSTLFFEYDTIRKNVERRNKKPTVGYGIRFDL